MKHNIVLMLLVLLVLGCGDKRPTLVPIQGKLTLDGVPLPFKHVKFLPENVTPGVGGGGVSDKDGNYSLLAIRPGSIKDEIGVPPGTYRVIIVEPLFDPEAVAIPTNPESGPAPAVGISLPKKTNPKASIPANYGVAETTTLKVEVPDNGGTIDLNLQAPLR
ncbi:MAG: hypothetical protein ACOYNM_09470 [Gemmataceae bacterium]|jgi:hypothetical protein